MYDVREHMERKGTPMGKYSVVMEKDGTTKYYFIRNTETFGMELLPSKYLAHKIRSNRSPNTVRRSAFAICYYLEYMDEKQMELDGVYGLDYEAQYDYFLGFLNWLRRGNHKQKTEKCPNNGTCNAYLKDVFRFYLFLEMTNSRFGQLSVLSTSQMTVPNAAGVKRTLRFKAFKGYLKEEERKVRAAEKTEIMTILDACTNCRDQLLILLTAELGYRIGEILGIDYTKDIDYANHQIRVDFRDDNENDARAKNAEERDGKVSEDTFEFLLYYLSEYWDLLQHQDYLFINIKGETKGKPMKADSVYDMFERMEKKTKIKVTPHMLRRYFANSRWEASWPLELISRALGHKHLDTTTRYLKVIDDRMKTASRDFYDRYSSLYGIQKLLDGR